MHWVSGIPTYRIQVKSGTGGPLDLTVIHPAPLGGLAGVWHTFQLFLRPERGKLFNRLRGDLIHRKTSTLCRLGARRSDFLGGPCGVRLKLRSARPGAFKGGLRWVYEGGGKNEATGRGKNFTSYTRRNPLLRT